MSLIGQKVGNYEIKSKLGEGGMGAVYLGEHPLIGKKVAIKVLLSEFADNEAVVTRFFNEAKAVNDIGHANIVDIIDFGKIANPDGGGEMVYFVMELLDGESLSTRLHRLAPTMEETMHIIAQCCSALAASHAKGIVHRDLKPDNLYLCPRGGDKNFVKILDFGIAKLTGAGLAGSKTRTGTVIGTPHYMSPEQCSGRGVLDHRSDVYSLGVVMYEMLSGRVPFPGEGFGDILVAHLTQKPDPPSTIRANIPPQIEAVVLKALEKERENRFQSMDEFGAACRDPANLGRDAGGGFVFTPLYRDESSKMTLLPQAPTEAGKAGFQGAEGSFKKPITTLSGAASELAGEARKSRAGLFAVIGVLAVGGIGGAVALSMNGSKPPPAPAAVVAPAAPVVEQVEVRLLSDPPGASVVRADGELAGHTPVTLKLKRGEPSFDVAIRSSGYKSQNRTITTDISRELQITLAKDDVPAVTTAVPAGGTATPGTTSTKKKKKTVGVPEDDLKTLPPVF